MSALMAGRNGPRGNWQHRGRARVHVVVFHQLPSVESYFTETPRRESFFTTHNGFSWDWGAPDYAGLARHDSASLRLTRFDEHLGAPPLARARHPNVSLKGTLVRSLLALATPALAGRHECRRTPRSGEDLVVAAATNSSPTSSMSSTMVTVMMMISSRSSSVGGAPMIADIGVRAGSGTGRHSGARRRSEASKQWRRAESQRGSSRNRRS
jgi:hypothetical protein